MIEERGADMRKIGVMDSGIGGTTVLREIRELLPKEDYIYYADSKNNPYGEKNDDLLYGIVKKGVEYLKSRNCKIVVLACNTATAKCIKRLREEYSNIVFVGTEPAIKIACDNNYKNVLVLATPATIESERLHKIIECSKKDYQNLELVSCYGLANAIERDAKEEVNKILSGIKEKIESEPEAIVLGCTHYPLIAKEIRNFFPNAILLDGSKGVAMQVKRQLLKYDLLSDCGTGIVEYIDTGKES